MNKPAWQKTACRLDIPLRDADGVRICGQSTACTQPLKKGKPKQIKVRNSLDHLHAYQAETMCFLHDFAVPFTNNQAERDSC